MEGLGNRESRVISDRPEAGDEAACARSKEGAADARELIARENRVPTRLARGEEHDLGVEFEVHDLAHGHPAICQLDARGIRE